MHIFSGTSTQHFSKRPNCCSIAAGLQSTTPLLLLCRGSQCRRSSLSGCCASLPALWLESLQVEGPRGTLQPSVIRCVLSKRFYVILKNRHLGKTIFLGFSLIQHRLVKNEIFHILKEKMELTNSLLNQANLVN